MEKSSILAKSPQSITVALPGLGSFDVSRVSIQRGSLFMLVIQNSALILTLHHARTAPTETYQRYLSSTAVLLVEVIKLFMSLAIMAYEASRSSDRPTPARIISAVFRSLFSEGSFRLILPALLYTLQNTLVYIAISNLDAVTFQVTYQMKILTTVVFSITLLGKKISQRQWLALTLLAVGISVVQISGPLSAQSLSLADIGRYIQSIIRPLDGKLLLTSTATPLPAETRIPWSSNLKGFLAVLGASVISGFTCVYFEKLMKGSIETVSVWTRNAQLAFFSIFPALLIGVIWQDGAKVAESGFFAGYTPLVWTTVLLQAVGGMIVAVCIAYADNVAKNFAASLSIVVSCAVTAMFNTPASMLSTLGTLTVLLAVYLYQTASRAGAGTLLPLAQTHMRRVYRTA